MGIINKIDLGNDGDADSQRPRRRAFTLAEVVVASGLLAIVTSGLFGAITLANHMIYSARLRNEAQMLVVDKMWDTFHMNYDDLLDFASSTVVETEAVPSYSMLHSLGGTLRTWVLNYGDYVYLFVRADWVQPGFRGGSSSEFEYNSMYRYRSTR